MSAAPQDLGFGRPDGLQPPATVAGRFPVTDVWPTVQSGRRPAKAVVGEELVIEATCYREGHDSLGVHVLIHDPAGQQVARIPMRVVEPGRNRWACAWRPEEPGDWTFTIEPFHDPLDTWRHRAEVKIPAGVDVMLELAEGASLLNRAADHLDTDPDPTLHLGPNGPYAAGLLRDSAQALLDDRRPAGARLAVALAPDIAAFLEQGILRDYPGSCGPWPVRVERRRALFSSWYEFFPRSENGGGSGHGTFRTAMERLPGVAAMGFDVLYLPPIHPIGTTNRKGPNNNPDEVGPDDPGSPWAIGGPEGGHDAVHPQLGTLADFDAFLARAREVGLEVALDLALQATPDHPWVREHPDWFTKRADGSIAYAENPPKKYQDIYPLNFDLDPEGLYAEVERVVRFWIDRGVRIFRVDNPHTKPLWVWDRLIGSINATHPEVIFLAEAFTLPAMMRGLAEVGFQQSYTYFTWRNDKWSLTEYVQELAGPASAYMRPNFWPNTPDILPAVLQHGGPPAFAMRATLAATLSPSWGMYAGYELFENAALAPGKEEYLDSEKFQLRPRDWEAAARGPNLIGYIAMLNEVRRQHPALQQLRDVHFHHAEDEAVIAYSKRDGDDVVLVVCSMDPHHVRSTVVHLDMPALGLDWDELFEAADHVSGSTWYWGRSVFVRLGPGGDMAHIAAVRRLP